MRPLVLALALVVTSAAPAQAADVAEAVPVTGSWTQLRVTTPLGDSPDLQSQDGPALPVENGPAGPVAYSAVRWPAAADLTLARVDATAAASAPAVWACPAAGWQPGDRQPWSRRPAVDCTRHVVGTVKGDHVTWRTSALGGAVDVLLVPDPSDTSAYAVSFGAPTADAFTSAVPTGPAVAPAQEPVEQVPAPVAQPVAVAPEVPAGLPPVAAAPVTVPAPPVVPVLSPAAAAPVSAAAAQAGAPAGWPGQLLLAFLSLLLVARAAFPSRPPVAPRSLVPRREHS